MQDAIIHRANLKLKLTTNLRALCQYGTSNIIDELSKRDWSTKSQPSTGSGFRYIKRHDLLLQDPSTNRHRPINKESINLAGHHFSGHTEILAHFTGTKKYAMLLIGGGLRVIHVTTHVSMEETCKKITKKRVHEVIELAHLSGRLLGMERPKIAVAGFNAHCSENGLFENSEHDAITLVEQAPQKVQR